MKKWVFALDGFCRCLFPSSIRFARDAKITVGCCSFGVELALEARLALPNRGLFFLVVVGSFWTIKFDTNTAIRTQWALATRLCQ